MNLKDRLIALYNLSQRGVGGERENAEALLHRILAIHNLTLQDFLNEQEEKRKYWFIAKDNQERALVRQIVGKITAAPGEISSFIIPGRKMIGFLLTRGEIIACSMLYDIYIDAFRTEKKKLASRQKKEREYLVLAFIHKHNIFSVNTGNSNKEEKTEIDFSLLARQVQDMDNIQVYPELSNRLLGSEK